MATPKKVLLLLGLLCASIPSLADSIFDVSGTLQGGDNGTMISSPAIYSGTVTLSYGLSGTLTTFTVTNWDISIPSIQTPSGTTSPLVFTPDNSTVQVLYQVDNSGSHWYIFFKGAQSTLFLEEPVAPDPNVTNYAQTGYRFTENGVSYYPTAGSATLTPSPVPEPSSAILLGTGLAGLAGLVTFRRKPLTS